MTTLRRVAPPEAEQTPERDAAADWLETHVLADGRWPVSYSQLADESEWSRQHMTNVVRHYFQEVDPDRDSRFDDEFDAYRRGYRDGWADGLAEAKSRHG